MVWLIKFGNFALFFQVFGDCFGENCEAFRAENGRTATFLLALGQAGLALGVAALVFRLGQILLIAFATAMIVVIVLPLDVVVPFVDVPLGRLSISVLIELPAAMLGIFGATLMLVARRFDDRHPPREKRGDLISSS